MNADAEDTPEIRARVAEDVLTRFVKLVLLARIGNGTWGEDQGLTSFLVEFPYEDDRDVRIQVNDEREFWGQPTAARTFEAGESIAPTDLKVEVVPAADHLTERFIKGRWVDDAWVLEIRLSVPHPRREGHLYAGEEFAEEAEVAFLAGRLRAFYECAFHAVEHLAIAELLTYPPVARDVATAKSHSAIRSIYQLWARLGNTDVRYATLLTELTNRRTANTYLRGEALGEDVADAAKVIERLREMRVWVREVVVDDGGPSVIRMYAVGEIAAGQLVGTQDMAVRPPRSST
ncbi:hypothetical protein NODU109028_06295 [Nocardioides dubius]|uniref:Nucleotidyltransferase n=1 Tax=Nocardioides dubius TaxID=317019 RepID=A0ABP4EAK0_9ACTN